VPRCGCPATDHAGIATQTVWSAKLRKQKLHRRDLGRDQSWARVWQWRQEKGDIILEQLRRSALPVTGAAPRSRWIRGTRGGVLHVFVELFRRGHIYRGKAHGQLVPGLRSPPSPTRR